MKVFPLHSPLSTEVKMQAVILAAGMGKRLGGLTAKRPKALVRVAGRELILRAMDFLDALGVEERIVVTGFEAEALEGFVRENAPRARCVRNSHFRDGSVRSIEAALPFVSGDLLIMNADHIYPRLMAHRIREARFGLAAACDFDRELGGDDMKVKLDGEGRLKGISKGLEDFDCGYIGMTICSAKELMAYRGAVSEVRRLAGDSAAVEAILGRLAMEGVAADICDTSGIRWLEVDTPEDLARAEAAIVADGGQF